MIDWDLIERIAAILTPLLIALVSAIGVVWGKKIAEAKDATIKAKEGEIAIMEREVELLKQLNSPRMYELHIKTKQFYEDVNTGLDEELKAKTEELKAKDKEVGNVKAELTRVQKDGSAAEQRSKQRIAELERESEELTVRVHTLREGRVVLRGKEQALTAPAAKAASPDRHAVQYREWMGKYIVDAIGPLAALGVKELDAYAKVAAKLNVPAINKALADYSLESEMLKKLSGMHSTIVSNYVSSPIVGEDEPTDQEDGEEDAPEEETE